jgi:uncharacterized tellurite resistance protein B-like protein
MMFLAARYLPFAPALLNGNCFPARDIVQVDKGTLSARHGAERSDGMHIILGFLGVVIGGIALWYWRFKMLSEVGRDAADLVGRARGAYRMKKFRKASEGSVLTAIDDPALAAAIFLFTLAGERPAGTQPATALVRFEIGDIVAPDKLDEIVAYAEWAARSVADPRDCVRRFTSLWREQLSADERADLMEMAENIAGPTPEPHQQLVLDSLRTALVLDRTR